LFTQSLNHKSNYNICIIEDTFDIPVTYKGKELLFKSHLLILGYIHKISVDVNGTEVLFEPDEERNYRAVMIRADGGNEND
jgi:hypothetical protein